MRRFAQILSLFIVAVLSAHAVPAVLNYAGQVAVNGQPFFDAWIDL
jgi:putative cell wall-binding protein